MDDAEGGEDAVAVEDAVGAEVGKFAVEDDAKGKGEEFKGFLKRTFFLGSLALTLPVGECVC